MITLRALTGRAKRAISGAIAGLAVLAMSNGLASQASEPKLASPWVTDHATRVRLIAGSIARCAIHGAAPWRSSRR